jgi:hypothetical protein
MERFNLLIIIISIAFIGAGLLFSFWPLVLAGIALLVLYGHTAFGVSAALLFDLIYGEPTGVLAFLYFPFILFALLCVVLRIVALRVILPRGDLGTL